MGAYGSPDSSNKSPEKPKKPFYKRWWFIVIVVIIAISIIGGRGEDKPKVSEDSQSKQVVSENKPAEEKTPEEPEFFKLGETVETNKIKATISDIEKPKGNDFIRPADGKEFVLLNVTIENISSEEINISSMLSFNAYTDDESMNESLSAQTAKEGTKTLDGTIAAGKKLTGILGYEVPRDWKKIEVHFTPDAWDDITIKWIIENK
ncbi:DUF4352 domain-containing protein [Brassicibacter mesophilus]|uniref:DUF4352 domain-containing protein n=1 Tax=Brassicibacter mesophilus TaxID=745119 RepID=UPI003D214AB7